ncbi:MAG: tetratricopeptide repeat protein [Verrucomicrobiia bacterium]
MKKKQRQSKLVELTQPSAPEPRSSFPAWAVAVAGLGLALAAILLAFGLFRGSEANLDAVLAAYARARDPGGLEIIYPPNEALFPPEITPPWIRWRDTNQLVDSWLVVVDLPQTSQRKGFLSKQPEFELPTADWEAIKRQSTAQPAEIAVQGFRGRAPNQILTGARVRIQTSADPVGAPIFYREVNLPFLEAVKDPTRIRWRFGSIDSSGQPPVVLEKLPVCGNCHSFSSDGTLLGMDVDYANDKGSYVIAPLAKEMVLAPANIISWGDFRREDGQQTYGFLSQVSPDGQRVASTVKDRSLFVARPDLAFSQLFFPLQGIIAVYERSSGKFQALPGADDPAFVQSNPVWSPDGKWLVFARAAAYHLRAAHTEGRVLLTPDECSEFTEDRKPFAYDLYRVPYNDGRGGTPEPLRGASKNGRSNFFPRYSPDGRWIVFCQAQNYMLLQPDSELFIIPAEGGESRRLRANTARMNSWHSWSPNGRWLVFSSKAYSDYTQLCLTHVDAEGNTTPAVLLSQFTDPDRAANIPEFVNTTPGAIVQIREQFLNDLSLARAAFVLEKGGEIDAGIAKYRQALALNPKNVHAHQRLGLLLFHRKRQFEEGLAHTREALRLNPDDGCAHFDLGMASLFLHRFDDAVTHLARAVHLLPEGFGQDYAADYMNLSLGTALIYAQRHSEAILPLEKAVKLAPRNASARYHLAIVLAHQGEVEPALTQYQAAITIDSAVDTVPELHELLALNYARDGRFSEAAEATRKALEVTAKAGRQDLVQDLEERLAEYEAK